MKNVADIYPLSPMQQGMLFHTLSSPDSGVYVEQLHCTLNGQLQVREFARAWQQIIERHSVLRTAFIWEGVSTPLQIVRQILKLPVIQQDWRKLSILEQRERFSAFLRADRYRGFELTQAPLMRLTLMRVTEVEYLFVWSYHHILIDGWSEALLLKEVFASYEAYTQGQELPLPQCRPYRDYIGWLQQQDLSAAESFWRETLRGFSAPNQLPIIDNAAGPSETEQENGEQQKYLSAEATSALHLLARRHQLTLNTLVQGAWALLLSRYKAETDVVFGTVVAGRPSSLVGAESMIGLFVNTLPVRVQLSADESLRAWLKKLQAQQVKLREYEYSPLVQVQKWSEIKGGAHLFESLLVFENYPIDFSLLEQSGSLYISNFVREAGVTNYPLTFSVVPSDELLMEVSYDCRLVEPACITRLVGHFQTLLEGMIAKEDSYLSELPLLTEQERVQLLYEWNDTRTDGAQAQCIHQLLEAQADRTPGAVAVTLADEQITYRELNQRANQLAHHLRRLGVCPEVLVGLLMERSLEMVIGMLGILKAGGAYVPLDPAYPQQWLSVICEDADLQLIVTQERWTQLADESTDHVLNLDGMCDLIAEESSQNLTSGATAENLAYVIYTSGSTGKPKGVMIQHSSLVSYCAAASVEYGLGAADRVLQFASISFDASVDEIFPCLMCGATLVLRDNPMLESTSVFLNKCRYWGLTVLSLPTAYWHQLTEQIRDENLSVPSSLRLIIIGGERAQPELLKLWQEQVGQSVRLINAYGPTEATVGATTCDLSNVLATDGRREVPIGRPIRNVQTYVLDNDLNAVPIGVSGELYIGGAGLARGYLHRPTLTAERFIEHPFDSTPGARLYKTGDIARYLPDGNLEFLGRLDEQVKVRGYRIEPGEIEAALKRNPAVRDAVVIPRDEETGEKRLVAYVVPDQGQLPSPRELRSFLQEQVPYYMLPSRFVLLERLPITPSGKIDRQALPAPNGDEAQREQTFVGPSNAVEKTLAEIWSSVLRVEKVGINDNFFELGGDSVLAIQIISRARQAELQLTPAQLFQHPTVAGLALDARALQVNQASQGTVTGPVILTPIQHWFFEQAFADPDHFNHAVLLEARQPLNPALVEKVVQHLLAHHDALRLRFTHTDSGWQQTDAAIEKNPVFSCVEFSTLGESDRGVALEETATRIHASLKLSDGPLMRVVLFDFGTSEPSRLLLVIHHLAVDGVSWRILLEDLQTTYQQLSADEAVALPPKTTSFKDWAARLAEYAQSAAVEQELSYWLSLPWDKVSPLPLDYKEGVNSVASERTISVSLSEVETRVLLQDVPTAYRTQINEVLLTALGGAFAQWHGVSHLLLDLEGHGREELLPGITLTRTVGWFTSVFPVLLQLKGMSHPVQNLQSVKEQLRRIPNRGIGYGLWRYLSQRPDADKIKALPDAAVSFNYLGQIDHVLGPSPLFALAREKSGAARSILAQRSHLLEINGLIREGQLQIAWTYSGNIHRNETIELLAEKFIKLLQSLIGHSRNVEAEPFTPSDFPLAKFSQQQLSKVITKINKASS